MSVFRAVGTLLLVSATTAPALAQRVELPPDPGTRLFVAPGVRFGRPAGNLAIAGLLGTGNDARLRVAGRLGVTRDLGRGFRGEVSIAARSVPFVTSLWSRGVDVAGSMRLGTDRRHGWIGVTRFWNRVARTPLPGATVALGATAQLLETRFSASFSATSFDDVLARSRDTVLELAGYRFHSRRGIALQDTSRLYADAEGSAWREIGGVAFGVRLGYRVGDERVRSGAWGALAMEWPMLDHVALWAHLGDHPGVPERRITDGGFVSIGFSLTPRTRRKRPPDATAGEGALPGTSVDRIGERRFIVVRHVVGEHLEMTGTLTDWVPVPLSQVAPGVWRLDRAVAPGVYRLSIRVGDGRWAPPPGLPVFADEFNGRVGLLVVP